LSWVSYDVIIFVLIIKYHLKTHEVKDDFSVDIPISSISIVSSSFQMVMIPSFIFSLFEELLPAHVQQKSVCDKLFSFTMVTFSLYSGRLFSLVIMELVLNFFSFRT
jgi:hypothetical protein